VIDEFSVVMRAREFIRQAGVDSVPVDLDRYLGVIKAKCMVVDDLDDEEAGQTTMIAGRHCLFINGRHSRERQRFTIVHEVAHIVLNLPSLHQQKIGVPSLYSYARRPQEEILCDVFAAECLLPSTFFTRDVNRLPMGFESIEGLAARYEASLTSTGSRFALVQEDPCAFVLAESGIVRYVSFSKLMREWGCWMKTGAQLPRESAAGRLRAGQVVDGPLEVEAGLWLDDQRRGGPVLLEEARLLPRWDQVLSLLWFETASEFGNGWSEEVEDDPYGVKELDGYLPWPSKKRRR